MTKSTIDIIDAEDLELYIDNEHDLYRDRWTPITTTLTRKKDAGTYNHAKAVGAFLQLTRAGAYKYQKAFPDARITPEVKRKTAESMRDRFEVEYELGNYKYLVE